jgi:hypothetical protein
MSNVIRFDRHANMGSETREEILDIINSLYTIDSDEYESTFSFKNWLYGMFDGYYYKDYLVEEITKLKPIDSVLADRVQKVCDELETYPIGETVKQLNESFSMTRENHDPFLNWNITKIIKTF